MEIKSEEYKDYLKEQYLNLSEAAGLLEISEEELQKLVNRHQVPTHTIAGDFLRLKKKDVEELKNKWRIQRELFPPTEPHFSHHNTVAKPTWQERLQDFWYFNDFYILVWLLMVVLLYFIVSSQ